MMVTPESSSRVGARTHFIAGPEKRAGADRRKITCYILKDSRCGIACRRRERQHEMEIWMAARHVRFYSAHARLI